MLNNYTKIIGNNTAQPTVSQEVTQQTQPSVKPQRRNVDRQFSNGGGQSTNSNTSESYNNWQDIQKQIKLNTLNSKNEIASSHRSAIKNMDIYLKSLGLQGTGLGQSAYTELANTYANNIANVNRQEQQDLTQAQNDYNVQLKEEQNQAFADIASLMEGANNTSELNDIMAEYGYIQKDEKGNVIVDENGNPVWNQEALNQLGEAGKRGLMTSYKVYSKGLNENSFENATLTNEDDIRNAMFTKRDGARDSYENVFKDQINTLMDNVERKQYLENSTIALVDENLEIAYLKWDGEKFIRINKDDYNSSKNKYVIQKYAHFRNGKYKPDYKINQGQVTGDLKDVLIGYTNSQWGKNETVMVKDYK